MCIYFTDNKLDLGCTVSSQITNYEIMSVAVDEGANAHYSSLTSQSARLS
jgi:hypothetical protein